MAFGEIDPWHHKIWHRIQEGVRAKNLEAAILFVDFSKALWLPTQREDGANTYRVWSPQRNSRSHTYTL